MIRTVHIRTFGCQMNEYDSLRILRLLESYGYEQTASLETADCVLLNTCTVRTKAQEKVYSQIGRLHKIKRRRPDLRIGVCGCLAQQEGAALVRRFPCVDIVTGTGSAHRLPEYIGAAPGLLPIIDTSRPAPHLLYRPLPYLPAPGQQSAFVTIMQGCDNYCTYCIVPYVRGHETSRPAAEIIAEVRALVSQGVREVTLLGQNVNSYGKNLSPATGFHDVLAALNRIDGLERIRFVTSHPKDLSDELIGCFSTLPKLCDHIHLPLQSGSDAVLKKMNRRYSLEQYCAKVARLRAAVPGIAITSDIIVGFPGETEEDFQRTCDAVTRIRYDDLFVFRYTDRPGTAASRYPDKVPQEQQLRRLQQLNALQRDISLQIHNALVGAHLPVLFESISRKCPRSVAGRTSSDKVVNCEGSQSWIGSMALVEITGAHVHSLRGVIRQPLS